MGGRHLAAARQRPGARALVVRSVLAVILLAALVLAVAVAVLPAAVRGSALTVMSPSMVPTLSPGDVAVTRPLPVAEIAVGDVITFLTADARMVTHRVIGVEPGPGFRTRGDANADPDPDPVAAGDVRGVLWYSVPWVGGVGAQLRTPAGAVIGGGLVALVAGALLLAGARRPT